MTHYSVLLKETIDALNIKPNGIYVDCTMGGAGHSKELLKKLTTGHLYCFDQDDVAIKIAKERLGSSQNYTIIKSNFEFVKKELNSLGIYHIDGVIMDLGMSSFQIDEDVRGFSYMQDAPLDMRMNSESKITAKTIVNEQSLDYLTYILRTYGEEEFARPIAKKIVENRPLETTFDLVKITDQYKYKQKGHSAKKVFQALRIAVNDELGVLERALPDLLEMMNPNGVFSIITFHSLEDRIVKHFFKKHSELNLPKGLPIQSHIKPALRIEQRKPILPTEEELNENSRSRSAKLRVAIKN
jgi:16S rRNA (cytosine1402-N4)-methyltransferase